MFKKFETYISAQTASRHPDKLHINVGKVKSTAESTQNVFNLDFIEFMTAFGQTGATAELLQVLNYAKQSKLCFKKPQTLFPAIQIPETSHTFRMSITFLNCKSSIHMEVILKRKRLGTRTLTAGTTPHDKLEAKYISAIQEMEKAYTEF